MNIAFKVIMYTIIAIVLGLIGFITWFAFFYVQVPKLDIPPNTNETKKAAIIDQWFSDLHANKKFNGAVLMTKDSNPILAKTYGFTNHKLETKLTPSASFRLASLSKQFTACGIMLLKEKGKLDYDDLVSKHIPNFPYEKATIRHLLNHTSSIPDNYFELANEVKDSITILTNEKAVQLIIKHKLEDEEQQQLRNEPNEAYEYSNTNYILLARVIELISKQSFEQYMHDNLFLPLGMNDTRVWNLVSKDSTFEHKVGGFEIIPFKNMINEIKPTYIDGVSGDGAVFSSINDFVVWDKFWYSNKLISEDNLKEAFKKPMLNDSTISNYGFGWIMMEDNVVMHNGTWLAANTYFIRNTKKKTSLLILDNSKNIFFNEIIEELEKHLLITK